MQVKNRRQEKVCVSKLNSAFFKKEQKGKEQKERDKQNKALVVIHT